MFYYTLGNIRPELRSSHRCVQLIACVTSPILDKYGFEDVLRPFIDDVNTLSEVSAIDTLADCQILLYRKGTFFYVSFNVNYASQAALA